MPSYLNQGIIPNKRTDLIFRQLRARRALSLLKDVPLRTRRASITIDFICTAIAPF